MWTNAVLYCAFADWRKRNARPSAVTSLNWQHGPAYFFASTSTNGPLREGKPRSPSYVSNLKGTAWSALPFSLCTCAAHRTDVRRLAIWTRSNSIYHPQWIFTNIAHRHISRNFPSIVCVVPSLRLSFPLQWSDLSLSLTSCSPVALTPRHKSESGDFMKNRSR